MTKRYLILAVFFSVLPAVAQKKKPASIGCQAPSLLQIEDLNEKGLREWLAKSQNAIQKVDEFICCLPAEVRERYLIGHSSLAAQNGVPRSPRVIFYRSGDQKTPFAALTVNGGNHPAVAQGESVEIAFQDSQSNRLDYFDLEFRGEGPPHLGPKNSGVCLSCHGVGGELPPGGMRPLFDSFGRWNRFVGGRNPFCSDVEKNYFFAVESSSVESMKNHLRYRCLDHQALDRVMSRQSSGAHTSPEMFRRLTEFNAILANLNQIRVAQLIRHEMIFPMLKNGLFGLMVCGGKLSDWLPRAVMLEVQAMKGLRKVYRESNWKENFLKEAERIVFELHKSTAEMSKALNEGVFPLDEGIEPPSLSEIRCENQRDDVVRRLINNQNKTFSSALKVVLTEEETDWLTRFQASRVLAGYKGDMILAALFEAMGVDTNLWQMSATGDGVMSEPRPLELVFMQEWKQNPKWAAFIKTFFDEKPIQSGYKKDPVFFLPDKKSALWAKTEKSCEQFRQVVKKEDK